MKINQTPNQDALKLYSANSAGVTQLKQTGDAKAKQTSGTLEDKVNISSKMKLFQDIQKAVQKAPDIRTNKVDDVQNKISTGTYRPDLNVVADKLLSPNISSRI